MIWDQRPPRRLTPANTVVIEVLASFRPKYLHHHTVEVETLHQHPGEGAQEEEMKQDGHDLTGKLMGQHLSVNITTTALARSACVNCAHRSGVKARTDEQQDLCHQDGEGEVGVDVVSLVTDGAHGAEEWQESSMYHQHCAIK